MGKSGREFSRRGRCRKTVALHRLCLGPAKQEPWQIPADHTCKTNSRFMLTEPTFRTPIRPVGCGHWVMAIAAL